MNRLALLGLLLPLATQAADPLFVQMQGKWTGEGVTTFAGLVTKTVMKAQVDAHVETHAEGQERLVSLNAITQSQPDGTTQTYVRNYWVEFDHEAEGLRHYRLGAQGSEAVTSTGIFDGQAFKVREDIGPELYLDGRTTFAGVSTHFHQDFWWAGALKSTLEADYERVP